MVTWVSIVFLCWVTFVTFASCQWLTILSLLSYCHCSVSFVICFTCFTYFFFQFCHLVTSSLVSYISQFCRFRHYQLCQFSYLDPFLSHLLLRHSLCLFFSLFSFVVFTYHLCYLVGLPTTEGGAPSLGACRAVASVATEEYESCLPPTMDKGAREIYVSF